MVFLCVFYVENRKAAFTADSFDLAMFFHSWKVDLVQKSRYFGKLDRKGQGNRGWRAAGRVYGSKPTLYLLNRGKMLESHSVITVWDSLVI